MSHVLSHAHLAILTADRSERPDKQVRAEPTRPPAIVQMEKKLFLRLLDHAKNSNPDVLQPDDSGASRKVDPSNPNDDDAEGDNLQIVLGSEARFNTAKDIVGQVRKRLNSMKSGGGKQDCSVCLTICGEKNMGHVAGGRCRHAICGRGDADWQSFKTSLEFRAGYLCYHCLLPTVSVLIRPRRHADPSPNSRKTPTLPGRCGTITISATSRTSSVPPSTRSGSKRRPGCGSTSSGGLASSGRAWRSTSRGAPPATGPTTCPTTSSSSGASSSTGIKSVSTLPSLLFTVLCIRSPIVVSFGLP